MSFFHLAGTPPPGQEPALQARPEPRLWVGEALASANRLWLRGRLVLPGAPPGGHRHRRWWGGGSGTGPLTAHLETRVSGTVLEADVPVSADGRFEALLPTELPPARRGWRVARNRLTYAGMSFEACALVLTPAPHATSAVVVVLPLKHTFVPDGAHNLARSAHAHRLTPLLHALHQRAGGAQPAYYLACVPPKGNSGRRSWPWRRPPWAGRSVISSCSRRRGRRPGMC
jgi:hypothetical protein